MSILEIQERSQKHISDIQKINREKSLAKIKELTEQNKQKLFDGEIKIKKNEQD